MGKGTYRGGGTLLGPGSIWFTRDVDPNGPSDLREQSLEDIEARVARTEKRRTKIGELQKDDSRRPKSRSTEIAEKYDGVASDIAAAFKHDLTPID